MTTPTREPDEIVAQVLGVARTSLDENAGMGTHVRWDSLKQLSIITELEREYHISIADMDILNYCDLRSIRALIKGVNAERLPRGEA